MRLLCARPESMKFPHRLLTALAVAAAGVCAPRALALVSLEDGRDHLFVDGSVEFGYDSNVFDVIPDLVPSGRGELEITDVNNHYIAEGTMAYDVLKGFWGDAGESIDAYYAVNDFVRTHGANKG